MVRAEIEQRCARCGTLATPGARFCASCGAPLATALREERRVVTVLFGDLSGFTELAEMRDAEEVKAIVDGTFAELSAILESFGGYVDKIIGDEIMAVFGAPVAHEDDAERAVRAALGMQRRLEELSATLEPERGVRLRMHIGINTGEVVAGYIGGGSSYSVVGDTVNTARRIEEIAGAGQILVGEATYEAARNAIGFEPLGEVTAKGKRAPVRVWAAIAERALPGVREHRPAPLVGREEELAMLEALAGVVRRDRRPFLATIVGDAGMGKSRLAAEFSDRAAHPTAARGAARATVLHGRSLPYGTTSPAYAIEDMLRSALRLDAKAEGADAVECVRERLRAYGIEEEVTEVLAMLGMSLDPDGGEEDGNAQPPATGGLLAPGASGASDGSALIQAALAVLERVAQHEGLLVLAFHDMHWAEDAVLDAIDRIVRDVRAPLLVLCLARPELLQRRPGWGSGIGSAVIPLEPLPRERAGALLDVLAPALAPGVRDSVLDRAGGNPFYIEELARLIVERGLDPDEPSAVPVTLQALVTARLDMLDPATKRLIQDAAVIGDQFWSGALRALRPDAEDLDTLVSDLVTREFIEPIADANAPHDRAFRFRQAILREVAEASVPKHLRAAQHAAVATWLEGLDVEHRETADLIAHHYERAATLGREVGLVVQGADRKARAYLGRAGKQALALDAAGAASEFLERALAFATSDDDRLALEIELAEALVGSWQLPDAERHLDVALAEARRLGARAIEGKSLRLLGDLMRMRGDGPSAREPIERALEIAKEVGDEREEAEGLRALGLLDIFLGRWSASTLWFRQALARYRALDDRRGEAWTLCNLGWANLYLRRFDEATGYFDDAVAIFGELGDAEGVGWSLSLRAWAQLYLGNLQDADATARQIEDMLALAPRRRLRGMSFALDLQRILRAHVAVLVGKLDEAERLARISVDNAERHGTGWGRALGRYPILMSMLIRGRVSAARAVLDEGDHAARTTRDPAYLGQFTFARAWVCFVEGDLQAAEEALQEDTGAQELVAASSGRRWLLASIRRAQGRVDDAISILRENLGRQNLTLLAPALARTLLADLLVDAGARDEALAEARTAVAEAGQDVYAGAHANLVLARVLLALERIDDAERLLRSLLSSLEGTELDVERVRALALLTRVLDEQRRFDESAETLDLARGAIERMPADAEKEPLVALLR